MNVQRTLILVKPDAFARGLTGEILARFERKGLRIAALRSLTLERELAERHYAEHAERPFFGELVDFITSGPLVAMVLEGTRGDRRRPPGDRGHQPAGGRDRQHPRRLRPADGREHGPRLGLAGLGRARDGAVLPGPRLARWPGPPPRPGLGLAPAAGDPGTRRGPLHRPRARGGRAPPGRGGGPDARQRARQGARRAEAAGARDRARVRHRRDARRQRVRQAGRPRAGGADAEDAGRAHARGGQRAGAARRRALPPGPRTTKVTLPRARRRAGAAGTWSSASGGGGQADTRSRAPAARWCARWRGTTRTSSGCPSPGCSICARSCSARALRRAPGLLGKHEKSLQKGAHADRGSAGVR